MAEQPSLNLILSDKVQELLDNFAEVMDLRVTFYDAAGKVIRRGLKMRNSDYCRIVQEELGELRRCTAMDASKQLEALQARKMMAYTCHAGLGEAIAPVYIDGEVAGFLMVGQFRTTEAMPENVPGRCPNDACAAQLTEAFFNLPFYGPEKLAGVLGLFTMLLDYLTARELATLRGDRLKREVERYIESHLTEQIKLPLLARKLGRSVSSLSHELKSRYDTSFSQLLIERRLSRAEELMRRHPERSIGEISLAVGIEDPYYFSRLYKKYRGDTPSSFRREAASAAQEGAQQGGQ